MTETGLDSNVGVCALRILVLATPKFRRSLELLLPISDLSYSSDYILTRFLEVTDLIFVCGTLIPPEILEFTRASTL